MHQQELGKLKERKIAVRALGGSLGGLLVFALAFVFLPYILSDAFATQTVSVNADWAPVTLTLDPDYGNGSINDEGHGDVEFGTITPQENRGDSKGTMRVEKKTVGVTSTGKYYSVYLSMANSGTDLVNGLRLSADSGITIPAVSDGTETGGTWNNPVAFSEAGWGYAVPSKDGVYTTPFSGTAYANNYNDTLGTLATSLTYDGSPEHYNQGTWAGVPTSDEPQQIWVANKATAGFNPASDSTYSQFDVYYAVMVDTDILAGTYSNNIVYTAISSAQGIDAASKNISRDKDLVAAGDTETLTFDLVQSVEGLLKKEDFRVFLVPHNVTSSAGTNYEVNDAMIAAVSSDGGKTIKSDPEYSECIIGSTASDFSVDSTGATLKCVMPTSAGGIENGSGNGAYDFWVYIPSYNMSYISKYTRNSNEVATVYYAGLQSRNPEDTTHAAAAEKDFFVTEMQEMTASVCKNTNIWGQGTGNKAKVYAYNTADLSLTTETTPLREVAHDNDYLLNESVAGKGDQGTFLLTDNRDGNDYLVRRLADGNCWMVQNLDLDLAHAGTLTSENTDLNSKASWDPGDGLSAVTGANTAEKLTNSFGGGEANLVGPVQFQAGLQRGTGVADNQYFWGTRLDDAGNLVAYNTDGAVSTVDGMTPFRPTPAAGEAYIVFGKNSAYARSYDNGLGLIVSYRSGEYGDLKETYKNQDGTDQVSKSTSTRFNSNNYYDDNGNQSDIDKTVLAMDGSAITGATDWLDYTSSRDSANYGTQYIGDYYNWYAATAESLAYNGEGVAQDSICPNGWKLPEASGTGYSWENLIRNTYKNVNGADMTNSAISSSSVHLSPLSIPFSGMYSMHSGDLAYRGFSASFWASTTGQAHSNSRDALFFSSNNSIFTFDGQPRSSGYNVRCVLR